MPPQKNKNLGIFGLGLTGTATYRFLKNLGNHVICYDDIITSRHSLIKLYGNHDIKDLSNDNWQDCSRIIISPGISPNHKIFELANIYNIEIISDIELLYESNLDSKFIGITGTNGKSTTTALTAHILKNANLYYPMGGNIGTPALSLQNKALGYVLELSSYQIDLLKNIKFDITAILNITPDHLDRYLTMENYINSKLNILSFMAHDGFTIINSDNKVTTEIINEYKITSNIIPFSAKNKQKGGISILKDQIHDDIFEFHIASLPFNNFLQGSHNMENIAASYAICRLLKVPIDQIILGLETFCGLAHRMQYLGKIRDISFYNDSKATNVDAASKSISALDNIYWLAGGIAKEKGLDGIKPYYHKIKKAYLYGKDNELFAEALQNKVEFIVVDNLEEAFNMAYKDAMVSKEENKNILLAPACASFDQFKNYEDRGNKFIKLYQALI